MRGEVWAARVKKGGCTVARLKFVGRTWARNVLLTVWGVIWLQHVEAPAARAVVRGGNLRLKCGVMGIFKANWGESERCRRCCLLARSSLS